MRRGRGEIFFIKVLQKEKNCGIISIREPSARENNKEEYRSGHNGPDSKSGIQKCIVGSNPTSSAILAVRKYCQQQKPQDMDFISCGFCYILWFIRKKRVLQNH